MIPRPARYLLRCDDLCPTAGREGWLQLHTIIEEFRLQPILAIVPDNRDPVLAVSPPDPSFWDRMRALQCAGATIGLHGFRHLCVSRGQSLLGLHRTSEFAGVATEMQRAWIHEGLSILRSHGLNPRIWVAPQHGFDRRTLEALRSEGIQLLCDGFAQVPFRRSGVTWIPQQLWGPVAKPKGVWTICVHSNTIRDEEIARLRTFLRRRRSQFVSVDELLSEFPASSLTLQEHFYAEVALRRLKLSRAASRVRLLAPLLSRNRW
jgi:predicted deacetylase